MSFNLPLSRRLIMDTNLQSYMVKQIERTSIPSRTFHNKSKLSGLTAASSSTSDIITYFANLLVHYQGIYCSQQKDLQWSFKCISSQCQGLECFENVQKKVSNLFKEILIVSRFLWVILGMDKDNFGMFQVTDSVLKKL